MDHMAVRVRGRPLTCAGASAFGALSAVPPGPAAALAFMTLGELAIAFSDVAIDGVVVERSRAEDQAGAGSLQSLCWGSQVTPLC